MAYTQPDLDRLDRAILGEELEVEFADGSRARYRSIGELMTARAHVAAVLRENSAGAQAAGGTYRFEFVGSRD